MLCFRIALKAACHALEQDREGKTSEKCRQGKYWCVSPSVWVVFGWFLPAAGYFSLVGRPRDCCLRMVINRFDLQGPWV